MHSGKPCYGDVMKIILTLIIPLVFLGTHAAAQDRTDIDALPDITELPALNLSAPTEAEKPAVDITAKFNAVKKASAPSSIALDDIPDAQKDLIGRLKYKKKEGSKIKRFKPEFGIRVNNDEIGATQKD